MASIMIVVGFAAAFAAPVEGADVTPDFYLAGSATDPCVVTTPANFSAKIDMNASAFDSPAFTAKAYDGLAVVTSDSAVSTKIDAITIDSATGIGTVTLDDTVTTGSYLIQVTVVDTVPTYGSVTFVYNYALNLSVLSTAPSVILSTATSAGSVADDNKVTALEFQRGVDFEEVYAYVQIGSSYYGSDVYDFYETNLPDGIAMWSTGKIDGKLAYTEDLGTTGTINVYAVHKESGATVFESADIDYSVVGDKNAYEYGFAQADGSAPTSYVNYDVVGYSTVKNDEDIIVYINDLVYENADASAKPTIDWTEYTVKYSIADDDGNMLGVNVAAANSPADGIGKFTITDLDDYTGIVQIQITKNDDYIGTLHVMVVGPVVHSGLSPAVTSA